MSDNYYANDPEFTGPAPKPGQGRRSPFGCLLNSFIGLVILLVLMGLLFPATRSSREAARRYQCVNNLKQIALALHNYESVYNVLPPAYTVDANRRPLHSWRTLILPYLEQEALHRSIDLSKPWNDPVNATARETMVFTYACPSDPKLLLEKKTKYLAIVAPGGCFLPTTARRLEEITDGTSNTLMVIEASKDDAVPWMAPHDADEHLVLGLGTESRLSHPGGVNAALVDGSVKFLKATIKPSTRRALISIAGGEKLSDDEY
jgi:prepilin-type processing-associated H-X9-DG protein